MEKRIQEIPQTLHQIDSNLESLAREYRRPMETLRVQFQDQTTALKAMKNLGQTQKTFIITGYNPEKALPRLQDKLKKQFQDSVHLEVEDCEEAPVLLHNRRLVRPFELFVKILRPPKYGSIDPTPYFALFFPIFFGLIMGDIGYGIIFLMMGLILRLKTKHEMLKNVAEVILICSGYTILFGFVFGECFGDLLEKMGILHPLKMKIGATVIEWNRMHSLLPLLILAIAIGVFHVTLGFILKLIQSVRHRHTHEAVEVVAILVALAGLFTLIGVLAQQIPALAKIPSVIAILVSVPLLLFMKGPMMLIELLSFVGNMLSYARLMAVGVASAYLAFVGNMLGGLMGNIILGAIIAILFHIINMVLAFSPTIQSARLHYVEFFSKFYESGGHLYQPLAKQQKNKY
jgi:V/A-type H+-transporting ATPase subunit I